MASLMSYSEKLAACERLAKELVASARLEADDGTALYCPDGSRNYKGIWTRDFCYLIEGLGGLVPLSEIEACVEFLIRGRNAEGCMPSCVRPSGEGAGHDEGDNAEFMVKLVAAFCKLSGSFALFQKHFDALAKAMYLVSLDPASGLVWIDPERPHVGYGFNDGVDLRGCDSFCSLLHWESARAMAFAARAFGREKDAARFAARAERIERGLSLLFDENAGAIVASSEGKRQASVWACAYFIHLGAPSEALRKPVLDFLRRNLELYSQSGQVSHLLKGEKWDRLRIEMPAGAYQNGAYWACASGWAIEALAKTDKREAKKFAEALMDDFLAHGVYECVNRGFLWGGGGVDYVKVKNYMASIANPMPALRALNAGG